MSWRITEELTATLLHVLVRDCPETLAVFLRAGVNVQEHGASPIGDIAASHGSSLLSEIVAATEWRKTSG